MTTTKYNAIAHVLDLTTYNQTHIPFEFDLPNKAQGWTWPNLYKFASKSSPVPGAYITDIGPIGGTRVGLIG
jgi:hypothetical protein